MRKSRILKLADVWLLPQQNRDPDRNPRALVSAAITIPRAAWVPGS
jgi:hypothetical protein